MKPTISLRCREVMIFLVSFTKQARILRWSKIFLSHYDNDHILGIVPLVRSFHRAPEPMNRSIFCSVETKKAIDSLFSYVASHHYKAAQPYLNFIIIEDRMEYNLNGWQLTFFDVKSPGRPEFGCKITFEDRESIAFLGDEPLREHYLDVVRGSDILIHEAFCLDKDQARFRPHEKNHSTAKEAAENASRINPKTLILFHTEDRTIDTRKVEYMKEAKQYFKGDVFVSMDGDTFEF